MISREDRYCPIAKQTIGEEVCFEVIMCLTSGFNPESVPEVDFVKDEATKKICDSCPYSNID